MTGMEALERALEPVELEARAIIDHLEHVMFMQLELAEYWLEHRISE